MKKLKKIIRQTGKRWAWFFYKKRRALNSDIKEHIKEGMRLHIGCGDNRLSGYVNIDVVPTEATDVVMDISRGLTAIPSAVASEIRLENVFEHFYRYDQKDILREFHRILKPDCNLVIMWLPDFDMMIEAYRNKEKKGIGAGVFDLYNVYRYTHGDPIRRNSPHQLHKDIFTKDSIRELLTESGFRIDKLQNEVYPGEYLAVGINIEAKKL